MVSRQYEDKVKEGKGRIDERGEIKVEEKNQRIESNRVIKLN